MAETERSSDSQGKDWRDGKDPSDLLFARDSQASYEDFQGRAAFYAEASAAKPLDIDLFITSIEANIEEHIQVAPHVADSFGIVCFGKAPMNVNITGRLADTQKTFGKQYLVDAYKNKLRLGACARTGKIPVLVCGVYAWQGPLVSLRITESSQSEDTLTVSMRMLVTGMQVTGAEGDLFFDFVHGTEEPAGLNLSEETTAETEKKNPAQDSEVKEVTDGQSAPGNPGKVEEKTLTKASSTTPPFANPTPAP